MQDAYEIGDNHSLARSLPRAAAPRHGAEAGTVSRSRALAVARSLLRGARDMPVALVSPTRTAAAVRPLLPRHWIVRQAWTADALVGELQRCAAICFAPSGEVPSGCDDQAALVAETARERQLPLVWYRGMCRSSRLSFALSDLPWVRFVSGGANQAMLAEALIQTMLDPVCQSLAELVEGMTEWHFALRALLRAVVTQTAPPLIQAGPGSAPDGAYHVQFVRQVKHLSLLSRVRCRRTLIFRCAHEAGVSLHQILRWNLLLQLWPRLGQEYDVATQFGFPSEQAMQKWIVRTLDVPARKAASIRFGYVVDRVYAELRGVRASAIVSQRAK